MFDNLDDPRQQALLAAAFGLLGGQGGKGAGGFARDLGQAGLLGLNRYAVANEDKRRNTSAEMQNKLQGLQYQQAQRGMENQDYARQIAPQFFQGQNAPADGMGPVSPPKADIAGYGMALAGRDPSMGLPYIQAGIKDNSPITAKAGDTLLDRTTLKPLYTAPDKPHWVDGGDKWIPVGNDGKPVGAPIPKSLAPGEAQRIGIENSRLGLDFARARDEGIGTPGLSAKGQREIQTKLGEKSALDMQAAKQELPNTVSNATQTSALIGDLINHPGMRDSVGMGKKGGAVLNNIPFVDNAYAPGTDAADFKARLDQLSGQSFLAAYQKLKGGGQITEVEGKKATEAVNRMKTSQSVPEFQQAALELDGMLKQAVNIAKQKAGVKSNSGWSIQRVD